MNVFPVRIVAVHHIVPSKLVEFLVPFLLFMFDRQLQKRYKCYTYPQVMYSELEKCGITRDMLCVNFGGTNTECNYLEWLNKRRADNL
jgi:hypothetical protein